MASISCLVIRFCRNNLIFRQEIFHSSSHKIYCISKWTVRFQLSSLACEESNDMYFHKQNEPTDSTIKLFVLFPEFITLSRKKTKTFYTLVQIWTFFQSLLLCWTKQFRNFQQKFILMFDISIRISWDISINLNRN